MTFLRNRRCFATRMPWFYQGYFSDILMNHREIWDGSEDIKRFFFPSHPTGYSAALARRRTDELQEVTSRVMLPTPMHCTTRTDVT